MAEEQHPGCREERQSDEDDVADVELDQGGTDEGGWREIVGPIPHSAEAEHQEDRKPGKCEVWVPRCQNGCGPRCRCRGEGSDDRSNACRLTEPSPHDHRQGRTSCPEPQRRSRDDPGGSTTEQPEGDEQVEPDRTRMTPSISGEGADEQRGAVCQIREPEVEHRLILDREPIGPGPSHGNDDVWAQQRGPEHHVRADDAKDPVARCRSGRRGRRCPECHCSQWPATRSPPQELATKGLGDGSPPPSPTPVTNGARWTQLTGASADRSRRRHRHQRSLRVDVLTGEGEIVQAGQRQRRNARRGDEALLGDHRR